MRVFRVRVVDVIDDTTLSLAQFQEYDEALGWFDEQREYLQEHQRITLSEEHVSSLTSRLGVY